MPNVTVYIRNEDLDKWKALDNKAQAISQLLNGGVQGSPNVKLEPINVGVNSSVWQKPSAESAVAGAGFPPGTAVREEAKRLDKQITRTPSMVYQEIAKYKADVADRLEYCQDPEERTKIETEGKDTVDALWAEYHQLKEGGNADN